jgi:hypothetical protein
MIKKKQPIFCFFLFFATIVAVIYSNTLKSPFLFDDLPNIVYNQSIHISTISPDNLLHVWQADHPNQRRKLAYLSFALNDYWGGDSPRGYHLVNIAIHAACGLLCALFFYQTLSCGWLEERYGAKKFWIAWCAAFLWVVHPIQVNAVTYIVQRMTSLAVFFALLTMVNWMALRKRWLQGRYIPGVLYGIATILAWLLGLSCKENIAIVPFLILVHEIFLLRKGACRLQWRWIIVFVGILLMIGFYFLGSTPFQGIMQGYTHRDFTLLQRLMTEVRVLWFYLFLFFVPMVSKFALFHDFQISTGILTPATTLLSFVCWLGCVLIAWLYRKRQSVLIWMVCWFLCAHLIESTIIPLEIVFEHRMYLPSMALSFGCIIFAFDLLDQKISRYGIISIFMLIIIVLGSATYVRNMEFGDAIRLYRSELEKYPASQRISLNLAIALNQKGRYPEAGQLLYELSVKYPDSILIQKHLYLFQALIEKKSREAEISYRKITRLLEHGCYRPYVDADALWNLANYFFSKGRVKRTLYLLDYLVKNYRYKSVWFLKGQCHTLLGDWEKAAEAFSVAWELNRTDALMQYWYGKSLLKAGEDVKGCKMLRMAADNPAHQQIEALSRELIRNECP